MLSELELVAALRGIKPSKANTTYARRVPLAALLGLQGTFVPGTLAQISSPTFLLTSSRAYRYNRDGVETLYLGDSEGVAGAEVKQDPGLSGFERKPNPPDTLFHVTVKLSAILDVSEPAVQEVLGTDVKELVAPWRLKSPDAPTQMLGTAALESGRFEAIRFPSAPMHNAGLSGTNLVIFRAAIRSGSSVELFDPTGTWREQWV